jgi:hypothetical protein
MRKLEDFTKDARTLNKEEKEIIKGGDDSNWGWFWCPPPR